MSRLAYLWLKGVAITWLVLGRPRRALAAFDKLLVSWPDDAYSMASRAHVLAELGETPAAMAAYAKLVESHPGHGAHWFNHGFLLERAERWPEALAAFTGVAGTAALRGATAGPAVRA